jgi:hypothetical protein
MPETILYLYHDINVWGLSIIDAVTRYLKRSQFSYSVTDRNPTDDGPLSSPQWNQMHSCIEIHVD